MAVCGSRLNVCGIAARPEETGMWHSDTSELSMYDTDAIPYSSTR